MDKKSDEKDKKPNKKYDAAYISYVEHGYSAAVFIVRDIVKSINTTGKWIDVLSTKGSKNRDGRWDFSELVVELFPRITKPDYPPHADEEERKYITWQTATQDIGSQRVIGYKGVKYRIILKLINKNEGKTREIEKIWNKKLKRYVSKNCFSSDCEVRIQKESIKAEWDYKIISITKL